MMRACESVCLHRASQLAATECGREGCENSRQQLNVVEKAGNSANWMAMERACMSTKLRCMCPWSEVHAESPVRHY